MKHYITINKKYHNEGTALERSVMNYWGGKGGGGGGVMWGAEASFTGSQPSPSASIVVKHIFLRLVWRSNASMNHYG